MLLLLSVNMSFMPTRFRERKVWTNSIRVTDLNHPCNLLLILVSFKAVTGLYSLYKTKMVEHARPMYHATRKVRHLPSWELTADIIWKINNIIYEPVNPKFLHKQTATAVKLCLQLQMQHHFNCSSTLNAAETETEAMNLKLRLWFNFNLKWNGIFNFQQQLQL